MLAILIALWLGLVTPQPVSGVQDGPDIVPNSAVLDDGAPF